MRGPASTALGNKRKVISVRPEALDEKCIEARYLETASLRDNTEALRKLAKEFAIFAVSGGPSGAVVTPKDWIGLVSTLNSL